MSATSGRIRDADPPGAITIIATLAARETEMMQRWFTAGDPVRTTHLPNYSFDL